jgi:hypothetical protein
MHNLTPQLPKDYSHPLDWGALRQSFGSLRVLLMSASIGLLLGNHAPDLLPEWFVQMISSIVLAGMMFLCGQSIQGGSIASGWKTLNSGRGPILLALGLSLFVFALAAAVCFWMGWPQMAILFMMLAVAPVANSSVGWIAIDQATENTCPSETGSSVTRKVASGQSTALSMIALSWIPFLTAVAAVSFINSRSTNVWNILVPITLSISGVVLGMVLGGTDGFKRYTTRKSSHLNLAFVGILNLMAAFRFATASSVWDQWQGICISILIAAAIFTVATRMFHDASNSTVSRVLVRGAVMKNTGIFSALTLASGGSPTILAALMSYTIAQHFLAAMASNDKNRQSIAEQQSSKSAA